MYVNGNVLTIVSRQSRLALRQAEIVAQQLQKFYPELKIEINGITTSGDEILDQPLNKIGGKGLFVKELENYLLQNKADIAVHSMKDMPADLPDGLAIGAILPRADVRDVFVSADYSTVYDLPSDATVGTSSLRRQAQILALRQDLNIISLRGNIETRLQKLINNEYAAIILAAAGLERLNLLQWLKTPLETSEMLPAVGQGALGIEYNLNNPKIFDLISPLNDFNTATCVQAERAMNAVLDGGCQAPIAALANINNEVLTLHALVASPDGKTKYTATHAGSYNDPTIIGKNVAQNLLQQGAGNIIIKLKHLWQNDG